MRHMGDAGVQGVVVVFRAGETLGIPHLIDGHVVSLLARWVVGIVIGDHSR